MLKPEQVPKEAVDALKESIKAMPITGWAEAAIAAALNAWPGMNINRIGVLLPLPIDQIPLTQEASDEPNYAATSGAYFEFDIPKPTPPGGTVVPFNGITTLDIDAAAAEIERLREALEKILAVPANWGSEVYEIDEIARAALGEKP